MLNRFKKLLRRGGEGSEAKKEAQDPARPAPRSGHPPSEPAAHGAETPPAIHRGPKIVHQPIPSSDLDPDAVRIVQRLTRFDHSAYFVGGCVRDLLLDRHPKDFDIGTSATPRQIKRLFRNCRIIGRRFRLAHVYFHDGKIVEVATFRGRDLASEETFADRVQDLLIRDDNVFGTPEEDALRRDFTINALFYDVNAGNVIDHADGLSDLRHRLMRTIGDPETRFREDPIRILRAIKFAARLDFEIEAGTLEALRGTRGLIPKAAPSRTLEELRRFCMAGASRRSFELMRETGVFGTVLPELAEPYAGRREATALLDALLEAVDRRLGQGHEPTIGGIFAAMLLPVMAPRLGWTDGGGARLAQGTNVPALVQEALQPISLRLKVPRAEQERCRQILATLHRMVRPHGLRRSHRLALARRPSFAEALWMLEAMARVLGGDSSEALERWRGAPEDGDAVAREAEPSRIGPTTPTPAEIGGKRRRRRRRRRSSGGEVASEPAPILAAANKPELPPTWDDNYFFAALPTVPPMDDESEPAQRAAEPVAEEPEAAAEAIGEDTPRSSRRRRRRRRKRPSATAPGEPAAPEDGSA